MENVPRDIRKEILNFLDTPDYLSALESGKYW